MKLISFNGDLIVEGTNARMKRLLQKIQVTNDRKLLRLLNRAYWREFFRWREEKVLKKAA